MFKFKDCTEEIYEVEVHVSKYIEGNQLGIMLVDVEGGYTLGVVSRNLPELHHCLAENQTFIPEHSDEDDLVQRLVEESILIPTDTTFPYNFYTMRIYDICLGKVDKFN